jgi:hypothetical protein
MKRRNGIAALAATLALFGCLACSDPDAESPEAVEISNPLFMDPASRDFSENPRLLERVLASPHGYFRFINTAFSSEVCRRYREATATTPPINLHGDAHLEQYAITDLGRGLTDFDDSSSGPAILDLLRLGVSLDLATSELGWQDSSDQLFDAFLDSYRASIEDPDTEGQEPTVARRAREDFGDDPEGFFSWVGSIMEEIDTETAAALREALAPYVESMLEERPDLHPSQLEIVSLGRLRMGIGSALDLKYLVRVAGPTAAPEDDFVLEVKEVRSLEGIECVTVVPADPFRILIGQSRIAYRPYGFLGHTRMLDRAFWVHAWVQNYEEVEIAESFESPEELEEVVRDIGIQLGRGHPREVASQFDLQLRREQLRLLDDYRELIHEHRRELSEMVLSAWNEFRRAVERQAPSGP